MGVSWEMPKVDCIIRKAFREEIEWINSRYDEIKFKQSNFDQELIAIAQIDGQKAGIGRLITLSDREAELGGIYVFTDYRGRGVAGIIVEFLLQHSEQFKTLFCIAFAHLQNFYGKYGFVLANGYQNIPNEVVEKYQWCKLTYESEPVLLMLNR